MELMVSHLNLWRTGFQIEHQYPTDWGRISGTFFISDWFANDNTHILSRIHKGQARCTHHFLHETAGFQSSKLNTIYASLARREGCASDEKFFKGLTTPCFSEIMEQKRNVRFFEQGLASMFAQFRYVTLNTYRVPSVWYPFWKQHKSQLINGYLIPLNNVSPHRALEAQVLPYISRSPISRSIE